MKKIIFILIISFLFLFDVKAGSITVKLENNDNIERLEASLVGLNIELFRYGCSHASKVMDESGIVVFDNLETGAYTVKSSGSTGYNVIINQLEMYLYKPALNQTLIISAEIIEGNLTINKYIGDELDTDAVFAVYHNDNLIKTLKYENGSITGKLEYGTYLVKQVGGSKYYEYVDDFMVTIDKAKNYNYDLYSDLQQELKLFFENKENSLNLKENELLMYETNLNNIRDNLNQKEEELLIREQLLKEKENEIIKLKSEIELREEEIKENIIILEKREEELKEKENELILLKNDLNINKDSLTKLEDSIMREKNEIILLEEELNKKINELEEEKLKIKQQEDKYMEDVLIVEVPNTYKKDYKKYLSISLIVIGFLIIIYKIKKLLI